MSEGQTGLLLLLVVPVLWALMWRGWRARTRRQVELPALPDAPAARAEPVLGPIEAVYVSSTTAGDWLDRLVPHGLGERSAATVWVHASTPGPANGVAGVLIARTGTSDVWIPAEALTAVRRDRGMAGKFVGPQGLVILTWSLGPAQLDTGLRTRYERDRDPLEQAVQGLIDDELGRPESKEDVSG